MESPEVVAVECPACGDPVNVVLGTFRSIGAVARRECAEGHAFWIRFGTATEPRIVVTSEPPEPDDRT